MDKSFNDDELADIMNEIESLEQEFSEETNLSSQEVVPDSKGDSTNQTIASEHNAEHFTQAVASESRVEDMTQESVSGSDTELASQSSEPADTQLNNAPGSIDEMADEMADEVKDELTAQSIEEESVDEVKALDSEDALSHAKVSEASEINPSSELSTSDNLEDSSHINAQTSETLNELTKVPLDIADGTVSHNKSNVLELKSSEEEKNESKTQITNEKKANMNESVSKCNTAMSFHVEGEMKLELSFHIGDQFVGVNITENGLEVGLEGGAKFTIPVSGSAAKKAA